jgi:hypothetical protein
MKTINVEISEIEYNTFGLSKDNFSFSEFTDLIERQIARQALRRCISLANRHGLSSMSMDEINAEVNAVRQCKR